MSGKEYVLPGAEQYRVVAVGPSGSKRGGTKRQFSIYEASTGTLLEKDRYPTQPLTEGLAYTARNLANTPSDRVIASLNDAAASRRRTVRKAVLQDFRARRSSARA